MSGAAEQGIRKRGDDADPIALSQRYNNATARKFLQIKNWKGVACGEYVATLSASAA